MQSFIREEEGSMRLRKFITLIIFAIAMGSSAAFAAQTRSLSRADLALYQGADREQILIEGAKKEGQLVFYTSNTWVAGPVTQEFEKKYPFIKANVWRSDSKSLLKRLTEEHAAGRFLADVVETSPEYVTLLVRHSLLVDHFSPELSAYDDQAKVKGKAGVLAWTNREIYISLGLQHQAGSRRGGSENPQGLSRPQMEGENVDRRNHHRYPVDRRHYRRHGTRVFGKTRPSGDQRPEYLGGGLVRPGGFRRGAALTDHLQLEHLHT
jgi:hypothetical protein